MISYPAMFDELSKIAETHPPKPEDMSPEERKKYVTKQKLINLAKVMGATGAGIMAGYGASHGVKHLLRKYRPKIQEKGWHKYIGPAIGGLSGGLGMATAIQRQKVKKYIEKEDEGRRSK